MNSPMFTDSYINTGSSDQSFYNSHYRSALERLGYTLLEFNKESRFFVIPHFESEVRGLPAYISNNLDKLVDKGFFTPESAKDFTNMLTEAESGNDFIRKEIMLGRGNGVYVWCECNMFSFINNPCILIAIKNINKRYEKELKMSREMQYHQILLSSVMQIYKLNISKDIIIDGNRECADKYGFEPTTSYSKMINHLILKAVHPEDAQNILKVLSQENIINTFEQGESEIVVEVRMTEPGESYIWVKITLNLLHESDTADIIGIATVKNIDRRKKREAEMQNLAKLDSLCNIYNHGTVKQLMTEYLANEGEKSNIHAVLIIDVDDFKSINDTYGHLTGDNLLLEATSRIRKLFRSSDIFGRVGGDEFLLLLKDISDPATASKKAGEINQVIRSLRFSDFPGLSVSVSIGIALYPRHGTSFEELFLKADTALYRAKVKGKNTFVLYDEGE
ncbi:MAG: GGDEF domain-containing protein [Oscillospiraceae bacterium]|nr:GGDEF domain-containing protein [Oscillospiraceae bacterium]